MRALADTLTASRLLLSMMIVWLGLTGGSETLDNVTVLILLGWTTDTLDGHIARRDRSGRQTWFSHNDLTVDIIFALSSLFYLTRTGLVSWAFSLFYIGAGGLVLLFFYSRSLLIALEVPLCLLPAIIAFVERPQLGWAYIIWAGAALILDHRRFFVRVRLFFEGWHADEQTALPNSNTLHASH